MCAYCGKHFSRPLSKIHSKSEMYFCCREHKDLAQRINSGEQFDKMRPDHYGDGRTAGESSYRKIAYANYEKKCVCCGYDEEPKILQVHHRDENHSNNDINNLVILCPNCHWKITLHLYTLTKDNQLIKN